MPNKACITDYITSVLTHRYHGEIGLKSLNGKWVIEDIFYHDTHELKDDNTPLVVVEDGIVSYRDLGENGR